MANNKILARDCLVWLTAIQHANWMYSTFVDPVPSNQAPDLGSVYLTRSMSIETTLETVDVTGVVAQIAANVDNRRETRITLSRMVPMVNFSSGVTFNTAARKFVPKDIPITLTFYDQTSSYRSALNTTKVLNFATFARSVEMTLRVENVRVDGTGDLYVVKRPSLVDGRCRIEGLMLYPSTAADLDYLFFNHDQFDPDNGYPRIIVKVTINLPVSGSDYWTYQFLGGISRYSVDVDNPMRQSLELVSIGAGGTSSVTGTMPPDPVALLFSVDSNGYYQYLAFAAAVKIPNTLTNYKIIKGNYGVEELTLSISENEVVYNLTGVSFDEKGFMLA